jgi:hypothetical protein
VQCHLSRNRELPPLLLQPRAIPSPDAAWGDLAANVIFFMKTFEQFQRELKHG